MGFGEIKKNRIPSCQGLSIIEIVVAMGIFSLIIAAITQLMIGNFTAVVRSGELIQAQALAAEGMEAVRSISERAWNELRYSSTSLTVNGGVWTLGDEGSSEQLGSNYTRYIKFFPVYRDASGQLVSATTTDAYLDVNSKKVEISVAWPISEYKNNTMVRQAILTDWEDLTWMQANWSGGPGQEIWTSSSQYDIDDGNIAPSGNTVMLKEIATSTYAVSGFLVSSAFNTGTSSVFNSIEWSGSIPGDCPNCAIKVQIKTAPDTGGLPGTWSSTWCGPNGDDGNEDDFFASSTGNLISFSHNGQEWIKYKAMLSGDSTHTPILSELRINHKPL